MPYTGSGDGGFGAAFSVTNSGSTQGPGIITYGSQGVGAYSGGVGLNAIGGDSSTNENADAGAGAEIFGGSSHADGSSAGYGAFITGGTGGGVGGKGGVGLYITGGDAEPTYGEPATGLVVTAYAPAMAAEFDGNVNFNGNISKSGGSFKIDHPLDPANQYLSHSFVESPDMKNIYDGNVVTDGRGEAIVTMPDWFEALNRDFRYQLTTIGSFSRAMVSSKMSNGKFVIRTEEANVEVSWQVTGVRQDAWANAHRIPVEEDKPEKERGHYTHPELYGHAGEPSITEMRHPRPIRIVKQ